MQRSIKYERTCRYQNYWLERMGFVQSCYQYAAYIHTTKLWAICALEPNPNQPNKVAKLPILGRKLTTGTIIIDNKFGLKISRRNTTPGHRDWTSCREGPCFGTRVWLLFGMLRGFQQFQSWQKLSQGFIGNISREFSSRPPRHTKPIPETGLHHGLVPVRFPLMPPFNSNAVKLQGRQCAYPPSSLN